MKPKTFCIFDLFFSSFDNQFIIAVSGVNRSITNVKRINPNKTIFFSAINFFVVIMNLLFSVFPENIVENASI